jgi:hypothetical protein
VKAGSALFGTDGRAIGALLLRYLLLLTAMNLAWEFAQMPLYMIGRTGTPGEIAFAALHCTAGDAMIGGFAMLATLMLVAPARCPHTGSVRLPAVAVSFGLAYTVFSEWLNVEVRESWAYSELMPRVPPLGTGLSPILQWLIIPPAAYFVALRAAIVRSGRAGRGRTWPQL